MMDLAMVIGAGGLMGFGLSLFLWTVAVQWIERRPAEDVEG